MTTNSVRPSRTSTRWGKHDHTVLVLQGGGALGAYQAGVYAALSEAGIEPDWVAGVSIGGINATLIAGNPAKLRVRRLSELWQRVSQFSPLTLPVGLESMRPLMNRMSAASAFAFGVPGFFNPRPVPPFLAPDGSLGALSFYDTAPLKATLEELVDFDLINSGQVRLSLGSVNLRTGNSVYFDNSKLRIGSEHVLASGALPPGFPPVEIEGELYWDGGIVSNSPLTYVMDEDPRMSALIFQVDVFSGAGQLPENLHAGAGACEGHPVCKQVAQLGYAQRRNDGGQRVGIGTVSDDQEFTIHEPVGARRIGRARERQDVTVKGAWEGPAALELMHHALAPVASLPVREVLSGVHILCDLTLALGTVVHDYLATGRSRNEAAR